MRSLSIVGSGFWLAAFLGFARLQPSSLPADEPQPKSFVRIESIERDPPYVLFAESARAGILRWTPATTNTVLRPLDRLSSGPNCRGVLRWSDQSTVAFGPLTLLEIQDPYAPGAEFGMQLIQGIISFFHRDKPARLRVLSKGANAGVDGTEFVLAVETVGNTERSVLSVIDGTVQFANAQGSRTVTTLRQAIAIVGQAPELTPGFIVANNVLQWVLYYPAVLDLREIPFTPAEAQLLAASLTSYREGDLLDALSKYPAAAPITSDAQRVYYAALLLAVGKVQETEALLAGLPAGNPTGQIPRLAGALRHLIAAVKFQTDIGPPQLLLASELMAASYYEQSRGEGKEPLKPALDLAQRARRVSPDFGFAWAREADLEFSFGRVKDALTALNQSLAFAPRNPQAHATKGFMLAAQNRISDAIASFNDSIGLDGALGNAWLGRGLAHIKQNRWQEGREELLVAATLEPQRAFFRSYLGKAYTDEGDAVRATEELNRAKSLDSRDPTAWLYSALLNQQENHINQAVRDLEHSQELNNNRRLYRSNLLLDQDRAVGSANLAGIYRDAGMIDTSVREAGRAVADDYGNYSAHLFLANSYDELRDPKQINLRYETATFTEYLVGNLLAPVGAGILSQTISQQEYSKLFERDRLGVASSTEYTSNGGWMESGAQFGTFGNTSYSLEALYRSDRGQRPNNDFEQRTLSLQLKQQLTPQDTVYLQAIDYDANGGDLLQYYDPTKLNRGLKIKESEEPLLLAGYHREWNPGIHTLVLAGWLNDTVSVKDPELGNYLKGSTPDSVNLIPFGTRQKYQDTANIYTAEIQQIFEGHDHTTIAGALFQTGDFHVQNLQYDPSLPIFSGIPSQGPVQPGALQVSSQNLTLGFQRLSFYGYHSWRITESLQLSTGLTYDRERYPTNFRFAPILHGQRTVDQISPKAGFVWTPTRYSTVRAAYSQSLGGASLDQSVRLEPTQIAGFNQAFRSIIPESIAAANAGASFETYNLSVEQRLPTGTYFGVTGEILNSDVDLTRGSFASVLNGPVSISGLGDRLNYQERSIIVSLDQLAGEFWSLGLKYRVTDANLQEHFDVPAGVYPLPNQKGTLNQLELHAICNTPFGFFTEFQALWNQQHSRGSDAQIHNDDFWQLNLFAGYRFPRRKAEFRIGLLNLTDRDYQLDPINLYNELPRNRTFVARLRFNF